MDGMKHGKGVLKFADGVTYTGDFYENQMQGIGIVYIDDSYSYTSIFYKGKVLGRVNIREIKDIK